MMSSKWCGQCGTQFQRCLGLRNCERRCESSAAAAIDLSSVKGAVVLFFLLFSSWQAVFAQAAQSPEYTAAKQAAQANWANPPLSADAGKNVVGVLTRDANELNAAKVLYKTATPAVRGAVDGGLLQASVAVKQFADSIITGHHCELTRLPATTEALTRAAGEITNASICLGGQPAETFGHKVANNGNVRALERQFTLGFKGHGDKQAAINKRLDSNRAGAIDFDVQQIMNNFSKNDIDTEIERERQASTERSQGGTGGSPSQ